MSGPETPLFSVFISLRVSLLCGGSSLAKGTIGVIMLHGLLISMIMKSLSKSSASLNSVALLAFSL